MGDLNCDWGECAAYLSDRLGLHGYQPGTPLHSFPSDAPEARVDWILISQSLRFATYGILADRVSDHLGVVAVVTAVDDTLRESSSSATSEPADAGALAASTAAPRLAAVSE